jgi:integrase
MTSMSGRQAKILSNQQVEDLLCFADTTRHPDRSRLMIILSTKAGLRAGEIAKLTGEMIVDAKGNLGIVIELRDSAAKKRSGRRIPIAPILHDALLEWKDRYNCAGAIIRSERGGQMNPVSIDQLVRRGVSHARP